jgi:hypothetical protein
VSAVEPGLIMEKRHSARFVLLNLMIFALATVQNVQSFFTNAAAQTPFWKAIS